MQKIDAKLYYQPMTDHILSSPRADNKPLTYESCGLTQRTLRKLLYHIHTQDPKKYCLRGQSFIKHKDMCQRISRYNLIYKTDKKILYDTSLSHHPPKHASIPSHKVRLSTFEDTIEGNNDYKLIENDIDKLLFQDEEDADHEQNVLSDVDNTGT